MLLPNCVEWRSFKNDVHFICNSPTTTVCADPASPGNTWSLDAFISGLDKCDQYDKNRSLGQTFLHASLGSSQAAPPPISLKSSLDKQL